MALGKRKVFYCKAIKIKVQESQRNSCQSADSPLMVKVVATTTQACNAYSYKESKYI